jgi:GNAT superfamily N-acetyltransferase
MQQWVAEGQSQNPETQLIRMDFPPTPSLIGPICDLITEINRNQPRDDLEGMSYVLTPEELIKQAKRLAELKEKRVIFATREPDNILSGMTDMFFSEAKPAYAHISLTGVRHEFQNHGLGKWLKAAMLLDLHEHHPEIRFVDTNNFNNNSPMLSINDRIGFKLFEQYVFYKIRVHDLAAKVSMSSSDALDNS